MRILFTGGRDYTDTSTVGMVLHAIRGDATVVHGGASGADATVDFVARFVTGHRVEEYPADWETHGKAAGPIRNQQMLEITPDLVIAFPGGRGTEDMKRRARAADVPVLEVG